MSRHLVIRCDAPGCASQTITGASDEAPTAIGVPDGWLTLIAPGRPHRHYCSEACLRAAAAPPAPTIIATPTTLLTSTLPAPMPSPAENLATIRLGARKRGAS